MKKHYPETTTQNTVLITTTTDSSKSLRTITTPSHTTRCQVYKKNYIYIPSIAQLHSTSTTYFLRHQIFHTQTYRPTQPPSKTKIIVKIISKQKKFLKNQIFFVNLRTTQIIKVNNRQNTLQSPYQYLHHRRNSVKDTPPKQHKLTKSLNLHLYVHVLGRTYLVAHNNY